MLQTSPVLPSYENPVLEPRFDFDSALDPNVQAAIEAILRARFAPSFYQFLNLLLKVVQPLSELPATGAAKAGAIALSGPKGIITTEALATAAGGIYTLALTNPAIEATSLLMLTVSNGTNSQGAAVLQSFAVGNGSATIKVLNAGAAPFNGTLVIQFLVQ